MPSLNEALADDFMAHAVDLARFEAGLQGRVLRLLKRLEKDLVKSLGTEDPTGVVRTTFQQKRLATLLASTRATIATAYGGIQRQARLDLIGLAESEQAFFVNAFNRGLGIDLVSPTLNRQTLTTLVSDILIDGAPTREWWNRQSQGLQRRFTDEMRSGILQQEPLGRLLQRVRGTRAGNFQDGIMRTSRHSAASLVRSSVQAVANASRERMYEEHSDLIKSMLWRSTLDLSTTIICQVRDGREYTLNRKPIGHALPWNGGPGRIHIGCRSGTIPRTKSWQELSRRAAIKTGGRRTSIRRAFERRLKEKGFDDIEIARRISQARSSMDGSVPEELTFPQWLRKKDAESPGFGAKKLGPTRWGLWRSGKLSFTDLVNFQGEPLTIAQLKEKIAA